MMGEEKALDQMTIDLKTYFTVKVEDMMNYVGCNYIVTSKGMQLHQPKLVKRIRYKFGQEIDKFPVKTTPATEGYTVGGMKEGDVEGTKDDQSKFSSGVGFCGYLVKHLIPDIANATCEHSKKLKGANYAHYKNFLRLLKFVNDTEGAKLKMELTMFTSLLWNLKGAVDTGFATDVDMRRSVTE